MAYVGSVPMQRIYIQNYMLRNHRNLLNHYIQKKLIISHFIDYKNLSNP